MKKILFVFGTRPEAIKMAPLINYFKKDPHNFKVLVIATAQHRQMLDQVLSLFNIVPDYDLDLMSHNQTLENLTASILNGITNLIKKIIPDLIFVQGDTTTTFAASLSAFYQKIPIAHIEAGLRTNNIFSPFPEEANRKMTSSIATYHFPPTKESQQNLLNEGIDIKNTAITGNTVIDSLLIVSKELDKDDTQKKYYYDNYSIQFEKKITILVTGHRRESFGKGFKNICKAIKHIAINNDLQFIYPVHLNPNVYDPVISSLSGISNIFLIEPQEYIPFIYLMKKSYLILTDSGGVQEEAPSLAKPILVMRDSTERAEGIRSGTAKLVGTNTKKIISEIQSLLNDKSLYDKMAKAVNPYGNGKASENIYNFTKSVIFP